MNHPVAVGTQDRYLTEESKRAVAPFGFRPFSERIQVVTFGVTSA